MFDRGQNRIGRSPSQGAETGGLHGFAEVEQKDKIFGRSLATLNSFENFTTSHRSNPAGCALTARFVRSESHEMPCQLHHVRFVIVDDNAAMPENRSCLGKCVIADGNIELR